MTNISNSLRAKTARTVTLIGAGCNVFLAVIKLVFGWLGNSSALVADGIHSLSDLLTDALVLLASHFGSRKADIDHPYGHQRIETAATLFLALVLALAGVGIIYDALLHLFTHTDQIPKAYALIVVIISIILNEALYHYTVRVGRKIQSKLLIANAWHHRSDAASSIIVFLGILGALFGYFYLDSVAAIIVGLMIIKMGTSLAWSSVKELVDTGVPLETLHPIRACILSVPGVMQLHELRTRCMAENIFVDAHILVNPRISVSEGHYIASKVHEKLLNEFEKIVDVTIHVDPEDDEKVSLSRNLPCRAELVPIIMSYLVNKPAVDAICDVRLHYLDGKVQVELVLPIQVLDETIVPEQLRQIYLDALSKVDCIDNIQLFFV